MSPRKTCLPGQKKPLLWTLNTPHLFLSSPASHYLLSCSLLSKSPSSTTTMASHALCHMSMQLVPSRKGFPTPLRCGQLFPGVRAKKPPNAIKEINKNNIIWFLKGVYKYIYIYLMIYAVN